MRITTKFEWYFSRIAEIVLKNNLFEFDEKKFKQKHETANGTKFGPPFAILFYIYDRFFTWEHSEKSLKFFMDQVKMFHPTS